MRKRVRYHILLVIFFFAAILILPAVQPVNSSSGAPSRLADTAGSKLAPPVSLPDYGRLGPEINLASGRFLVASPKLMDPNFHETVVLILRYGEDGASGVVINRPLNVKLSAVMPEFKDSGHRDEFLYLGGPVETDKMLMLVKSAKTPPESIPVLSDVHLSTSRDELQRLIQSTDKEEKFKIFAGYAGWAPGQLESERNRGDWHVLKADAETVFDRSSPEIWPELIHRLKVEWVHLKNRILPETIRDRQKMSNCTLIFSQQSPV